MKSDSHSQAGSARSVPRQTPVCMMMMVELAAQILYLSRGRHLPAWWWWWNDSGGNGKETSALSLWIRLGHRGWNWWCILHFQLFWYLCAIFFSSKKKLDICIWDRIFYVMLLCIFIIFSCWSESFAGCRDYIHVMDLAAGHTAAVKALFRIFVLFIFVHFFCISCQIKFTKDIYL